MVGFYNLYKGSQKTPLIYLGDRRVVKKVYKGNQLIYQIGFDTFSIAAGATNTPWTVPPGVSQIHVDCVASKGFSGGNGGRVQCDLNVSGGQTLYITVGNIPTVRQTAIYNASDIRINGTDYSNRVIVAGGGGSQGAGSGSGGGGAGGGLTSGGGGSTGCSHGGYSATQTSGGAGGGDIPWTSQNVRWGASGTIGMGGDGAVNSGVGGAGGAGYYGGGGGAGGYTKSAGNYGGGGAGGSSYTHPTLCSNVVHTQGFQNGNGYITISFVK